MLTSNRPEADDSARSLLAKVSPVRGWPASHPVNNSQGWRAYGDSVMEISMTDGNQAGWLLLVVTRVVASDHLGG